MQAGTQVTCYDSKESRKHYRTITGVNTTAPFDLSATLAHPLQAKAVCPPDGDPGKRVCAGVVSTVNRLPFKVPPNSSGRAESMIDGCTLISGHKSCLSRRVTNDRDAFANKPSSQSVAMRVPVLLRIRPADATQGRMRVTRREGQSCDQGWLRRPWQCMWGGRDCGCAKEVNLRLPQSCPLSCTCRRQRPLRMG